MKHKQFANMVWIKMCRRSCSF